ncbi:hypothetical protein Bhyg_02255 [Pseudolycoriella hygida]|uniref:Uncharacterized protein n=1 Tax=Pseudolycoriella hygida TaxID=35572 RepID=A0A9Q0NBP8_9DIPT|nr:hypothetical protein Bhyg_02255 [Pseudolycoriella hygida]
MLRLMIIALVFAVPNLGHRLEGFSHKITKKIVIAGNYAKYGTTFSEKCISVSGEGVDFVKHERLFDEYDDCINQVGNFSQFGRYLYLLMRNVGMIRRSDSFSLSETDKLDMVEFSQTFCHSIIDFIECDDLVAPVYQDCYTNFERNETEVGKAAWLQMLENMCENKSERLVNVINSEGLECRLKKGSSCLRESGLNDPISNPKLEYFCSFHDMAINCMGPAFKECGASDAADTLVKSIFTNIESQAICKEKV